jgi:hypothetical protein
MSYIGNQPTSVAFLTDQFSGTGSQTAFTLSAAPANTASIIVAVSGVLQDPTTYSTSGLTLTFSAAPPSGTGNISVRFLGIPASNIATTAYRTQTEFTATAGQTTFSVPSYTVGYIDVYRNGVLLGSADYTATSGTTVVLASGATAGDLVETISFFVSSVLNAIPAVNNAVTDAYINTGAVTQSKLGAGVAGNGPAFFVCSSGSFSIVANVVTKIPLNNEIFDSNNCFDATTNYRFTPNVAGYYQINVTGVATWATSNNAAYYYMGIFKNGSLYTNPAGVMSCSNGNYAQCAGSSVIYMNGSTDYVELWCGTAGGGNLTLQQQGNTLSTSMSGSLVRAA